MNHEHIPEKFIALLNSEIEPFSLHDSTSYASLLEKIGDARLVLMGEASHGTQEFYEARIALSRYLIQERDFQAIAIEGDWTSCYPVHQYIQGQGNDDPIQALEDFNRFPKWMWRNTKIPPFLQWLRQYNDALPLIAKVGFYGLDLYCLNDSIEAVIQYLNQHDSTAAQQVRERYSCFDHTAADPQTYGHLVSAELKKTCVHEVTEQLLDVQRLAFNRIQTASLPEQEALFYTTQNARLIKNAENYYRGLFESRDITWNIRDQHMAETLQNLIAHLETRHNKPAKVILWAHNSHVGDARATEMSDRGEVNLGQLVRERFNTTSFLLGFSTYDGTVTAADYWDEEGECKIVNPGIPSSYEDVFHHLQYKNFMLGLRPDSHANQLLKLSRLQRAIGVIYRPETERMSHYYFARLPYQFDTIIHLDHTQALEPLK